MILSKPINGFSMKNIAGKLTLLMTIVSLFSACSAPENQPSEFQISPIVTESLEMGTTLLTTPIPPQALEGIGSDGLGDGYYPLLGNGGYDVQNYAIELEVNMDTQFLQSTVTIDAIATTSLSQFNLDFIGFTIFELTVNSIPAEFDHQSSELVIMPSETLTAGAPFTVVISFYGIPEHRLPDEYDSDIGWSPYEGGVMVAGEPMGSAGWYPVNQHPLDKATYLFEITVPKPYIVAANGILLNEIESQNKNTFIWESTDPIASYLVTIAIAEFEREEQEGPDGLLIRNYFDKAIPAETRSNFERTPEMIALFNEKFGPYPFDAYGVVVHNIPNGFALETQTLSVFGSSFNGENVVAHELAHQWFGDSVSISQWQDIWLNEGFATFASSLWTEHAYGKTAAENEIRSMYGNMAGRDYGPYFTIGDPGASYLFASPVYQHGALTLHSLRYKLHDEIFFAIMQTYADRFYHSNATIQDFIDIAEEISGEPLQSFFDEWLNSNVIPDIPELGLYQDNFVD
jgi:aminopeptidase N